MARLIRVMPEIGQRERCIMALHKVFVTARFTDAAERVAEVNYLLSERYDDVAENMADVQTAATDLIAALNTLTWDQIATFSINVEYDTASPGSNIAANNQVRAFVRTEIAPGLKGSFEVPAWDDAVFDQDSNNLLSPTFNVAAQLVANLIDDPETEASIGNVQWSQSRTRKSGIRLD